jgi:DNA-binding LacI/PurR family transcriptional regulator
VGDETRARILRAAEELGWRPSVPARALTQARAGAVGLVLVREPDCLEFDGFFVRFLTGVERTLAVRGYGLLLQVLSLRVPGSLEAYRRLLGTGRVDGVLVTDVVLDDRGTTCLWRAACRRRWPAGRSATARSPPWSCSTRTVWRRSSRPDRPRSPSRRVHRQRPRVRVRGDATSRVDEHASPRRSRAGTVGLVVPEDAFARAATARLVNAHHRPTAIVYMSDMLALAGIGVAHDLGLDVPGDICIAGFDDSPVARLSSPPLTTVRVDYAGFGEAAAALLPALIEGAPPPPFEPAAPELVVRGSTAPRPAELVMPARRRRTGRR